MDESGAVLIEKIAVALETTDPRTAPSYVHGARWHGEMWIDGDLMDALRDDQRCVLILSTGAASAIRVNSWDLGGKRAQIIGVGETPF